MKAGEGITLPATGPLQNVENAGSSDLGKLIEAKLNESASRTMQTQELLSRKRRYLVFPEGSSFQMGKSLPFSLPPNDVIYVLHLFRSVPSAVFDEIICMVDYTNYLVLGITVALAWELPSKPPSEAIEDILNKLEDGTIDVSRNDTVSNITYVDDAQKNAKQTNNNNNNAEYKPNYINLSNGAVGSSSGHNSYYSSSPVFRTPMHPTYRYSDSFYRRPSEPARRKDNHYYYSRPVSSMRNPFQSFSQPFSRAPTTRYPYWALASQ